VRCRGAASFLFSFSCEYTVQSSLPLGCMVRSFSPSLGPGRRPFFFLPSLFSSRSRAQFGEILRSGIFPPRSQQLHFISLLYGPEVNAFFFLPSQTVFSLPRMQRNETALPFYWTTPFFFFFCPKWTFFSVSANRPLTKSIRPSFFFLFPPLPDFGKQFFSPLSFQPESLPGSSCGSPLERALFFR